MVRRSRGILAGSVGLLSDASSYCCSVTEPLHDALHVDILESGELILPASCGNLQYPQVTTSVSLCAMSSESPPAHLAHVPDDELVRLATLWRSRASRGDREAFGIAHALEVEQRRRQRPSQLALLQLPRASRPWWRFWDEQRVEAGGRR